MQCPIDTDELSTLSSMINTVGLQLCRALNNIELQCKIQVLRPSRIKIQGYINFRVRVRWCCYLGNVFESKKLSPQSWNWIKEVVTLEPTCYKWTIVFLLHFYRMQQKSLIPAWIFSGGPILPFHLFVLFLTHWFHFQISSAYIYFE